MAKLNPGERGRKGGLLAILALLTGVARAVAQEAPAPRPFDPSVAPGFWDLARNLQKPDLSGLRLLRIITDDDYPPFDFVAPDGALTGFNVELGRAICEELRLQCTVQARRWNTILDTIEKGEADAAIASLALNAANRARVDFTSPYYRTPGRFVARTGADLPEPIPENLAGRVIGVEAGTAHEAFVTDLFAGATVRSYPNAVALRAALRQGEADFIFGDGVSLAIWLNSADAAACCGFRGGPYVASEYFGDGVGIAVAKRNTTLRLALDFALRRLAARGVFAELYLKYFPVGFF